MKIDPTDTEMMDWIEATGAQIWRERPGTWTVFVRSGMTGGLIKRPRLLQPTRPTLRAAIMAAMDDEQKV